MSKLNDMSEDEHRVLRKPQHNSALDGNFGRSGKSTSEIDYGGRIDGTEQDTDGITINNPKYILIGEEESLIKFLNSKKLFNDFEEINEPLERAFRTISSDLREGTIECEPSIGNDIESLVISDSQNRYLSSSKVTSNKEDASLNNTSSMSQESSNCSTGDGCWRSCECRKSILTIIGHLKKQDKLIVNLYDYYATKKAKRAIVLALMTLAFIIVFFWIVPTLDGFLPDFIRDSISNISSVVIGACVTAIISLSGFSYLKFESIKDLIIRRMSGEIMAFLSDASGTDLDEISKRLTGC